MTILSFAPVNISTHIPDLHTQTKFFAMRFCIQNAYRSVKFLIHSIKTTLQKSVPMNTLMSRMQQYCFFPALKFLVHILVTVNTEMDKIQIFCLCELPGSDFPFWLFFTRRGKFSFLLSICKFKKYI